MGKKKKGGKTKGKGKKGELPDKFWLLMPPPAHFDR